MRSMGFLTAAVAGTAMLLAACSSASSSRPVSPLAALSAHQVVTKALSNLKSASSVRIFTSGPLDGNQEATGEVTLAPGGCELSFTTSADGSEQIIVIGSSSWVMASEKFWKSQGAGPEGALLSGKYVVVPASKVSGLAGPCFLQRSLAGEIGTVVGDDLVESGMTTIDGQQVLVIRDDAAKAKITTIYVTDSATPEILRISGHAHQISVTDYNAQLKVTAPPAGEVVNPSQLEH